VTQLKKIILRAGDLPSSWKAVPTEPEASDSGAIAAEAEMTKCVGTKSVYRDIVARASSDDYTLGNAIISTTATSFKSQSALDSDIGLLKSPKFIPCFTQSLKKEIVTLLPQDASLGAVSVKLIPGPGAGPANVVGSVSVTASLTVGGQPVTVYVSNTFVTGPLMEVMISTENAGSPVPAAVLQSAVKAVADRAAANS
jgi:hypothetical protein